MSSISLTPPLVSQSNMESPASRTDPLVNDPSISTSSNSSETNFPSKEHSSSINESATNGDSGSGGFSNNSLVWVRLGQSWWPGLVVSLERCPQDFLRDLKKTPLAVVKFFEESGFVDIHKSEHIYPYNCDRKKEFIKKGINFRTVQNKEELYKKFEADVLKAQKLTGGQLDVFSQIEDDLSKRRIDYSNLGFGPTRLKKKKDAIVSDKKCSDISEAVRYKKENSTPVRQMKLEHKVVIMEQPHVENMKDDLNKSCNSYKCNICGYSCTRLGVIIWHNKAHIKTVMNYDSGIRVPGRRKRKSKKHLNGKVKMSKKDAGAVDHIKSNGHVDGAITETNKPSEAIKLLMDWDDGGEEDVEQPTADAAVLTTNGGGSAPNGEGSGSDDSSGSEDEKDHEEERRLQQQHRAERGNKRPMRGTEDLNSAFDALLADTPVNNGSSNTTHNNTTYSNNGSDSEASDWEKYYAKDSDNNIDSSESESEETETSQQNDVDLAMEDQQQQLDDEDEVAESDIKSIFDEEPEQLEQDKDVEENSSKDEEETGEQVNRELSETNGVDIVNGNAVTEDPRIEEDNSSSTNGTGVSSKKDEEEVEEDSSCGDGATAERSVSSSPSSSSGPAFMLVAVDAHGNNVPMPALTDRSQAANLNMVAVEASMEDGTSRTLYIDPAYLEPNVDLSNLMLHIDNSGQETVIIPSSCGGQTASDFTPSYSTTGDTTNSTTTLPTTESTTNSFGDIPLPTDTNDCEDNSRDEAPADTELPSPALQQR